MEKILTAPAAAFQVHPEVLKVFKKKNIDGMLFQYYHVGQQTPIDVVEIDGQLYIIDGVANFYCINILKIPLVKYRVVDVEPEKIMEYRLFKNVRPERTFTEKCLLGKHWLDLIGNSQGRKRDQTLYAYSLDAETYEKFCKDKYQLVGALIGLDFKESTFRKAMKIFEDTYNPEGKSMYGILELLDAGEISIDRAFKILANHQEKEKVKHKTREAKLGIVDSVCNSTEIPYQLHNKSSMNMDAVEDNSVALIIDSHPYFNQRSYRNQDELFHGQEKTKEEYFENFRRFNEEKLKKLKPGGVLVTILGESYKGGYQGICNRAEQILEEIGFEMIDTVVWVKTNQKWTVHPCRFQNVKETILVAKKPGAEPYFSPVLRPGSAKSKSVKRSNSKGGFYIPNLETCIPNVIVTEAFNWKELSLIDSKFRHDAPCPSEIYEIFIEAYSQPGDTILDGFVGTGTIGLGLKTGRRVIGYDVDNESLEFCRKRFDHYLSELVTETQSMAA